MITVPDRTYSIHLSEPDEDGKREFDILADGETMLDEPLFIAESASLELNLNVEAHVDPAFGRGWGGFTEDLNPGDSDG